MSEAEAGEIARACGCLPLALRVAGNYLGLNEDCAVGDYLARLAEERERLKVLRDPEDPDLDVEAAIGLSVGQLEAELREAWGLLALFPAPFDLAGAGALWDDGRGGDAGADGALRNRSLLSYDEEPALSPAEGTYYLHDLLRLAAGREVEEQPELVEDGPAAVGQALCRGGPDRE